MKKTKVIIPALGILLLSTAASVTGTVAWFSMNTSVFAEGMTVKAEAETGIVISNSQKTAYGPTASAYDDSTSALKPASTWNCTDWYHSVSTDVNDENTGEDYTAITSAAGYYVCHEFYIRSSAYETFTVQSLNVENVSVVDPTTPAQALSKALRVGVLLGADTTAYIYAPVSGATLTYNVHKDGDAADVASQQVKPKASGQSASTVTSIPGNTADGVLARVFIWFEGEDAACISKNIVANLESLEINVEFGYTAVPSVNP